MTRNARDSFGPAAICSGFDLSCCCVALQVRIDMTSRILCHYGSGHDLAKGTMYLLPCSFNNDVALQMLRVLKYVNRGFKLVGVAKDHHCCPRCELCTEKWISGQVCCFSLIILLRPLRSTSMSRSNLFCPSRTFQQPCICAIYTHHSTLILN